MNHTTLRKLLARGLCALTAWALFSLAAACSEAEGHDEVSAQDASAPSISLRDAPVAEYRTQLLDLAFEAASAFPLDPHIKNRSRAQEEVVLACLELQQDARARRFADGIANWQRGTCYAELAYRLAERGAAAEARACIALAQSVADTDQATRDDEVGGQQWRRDRIVALIAKTEIVLGAAASTAALTAGLAESEVRHVARASAARAPAAEFDERMANIDQWLATANFELILAAYDAGEGLFDRFYDDAEKRDAVEQKIKGSWSKMPIDARVETLLKFGEVALRHADRAKALELARESKQLIDGSRWRPEQRIDVGSRVASLCFRAGDAEAARADAGFALALYDAEQQKIVDIRRAGALRSLAEAYHTFGDRAAAAKVYSMALEAGVANPNSRPRCDDLVSTCCSMASKGFEPDAALLARVRTIRAELGAPW